MMFLLRVAFWLSVVIILIPGGSPQPKAGPQVQAADTISAASAAVADMRQFCVRQPEACTIGSHAATTFGYKAQAGAKMLYEFLNDKLAPAETGSIPAGGVKKTAATARSQDTLRSTDLAPGWRGPVPRPDPRGNRAI